MITDKILTKDEVLKEGVCFEDELDWGGEHYQQIVRYLDNGEEEIFIGLSYDLFPDGSLESYEYIKDGYKEGQVVRFYSNGQIKCNLNLVSGTPYGAQRTYYESGQVKTISYNVVGREFLYVKFDESGQVIRQKLELTQEDIQFAERFGVNLSDIRLDV